jgi:ssRNA-specific RNase YbeY (16S rRNA maturation enzyme)
MINIYSLSRFKIDKKFVVKVAQEYLATRGVEHPQSLNIVFVGKRKMIYIATVYKKEPEALPVLTFDYCANKRMMPVKLKNFESEIGHADKISQNELATAEDEDLLGEIFVCYPQAVLLAAERNKKVNEILRWLVEHAIDNLLQK